jgi:hypothetical protein
MLENFEVIERLGVTGLNVPVPAFASISNLGKHLSSLDLSILV